MKKVLKLLDFFYKTSNFEEWNTLFKIANQQTPDEYLEQNYPDIYKVFLLDTKPAAAWISIINQLKNKGLTDDEIKELEPGSFEDLKAIMKEGKDFLKKQKKDRYFLGIEDPELTDELKNEIINSNISREVFLYLYNQEQHTLKQRIDMYKDIIPKIDTVVKKFPEFNHNIIEYETLDEFIDKISYFLNRESKESVLRKLERFYDYIWDGVIHEDAPPGTYDTYTDVEKGGAKANSKIIGEFDNHIMVHSYSKEAAQYWERGAVEVSESGSLSMKTCTSRIYDPENFKKINFYSSYELYDIYQVIRKDAMKDGAPMFYHEVSGAPNHLITLCVDDKREVKWGGQDSVNSEDLSIEEKDFVKEVGKDNYDKFLNIILNNLTVKNLVSYTFDDARKKEDFDKIILAAKEISPFNFIKHKIYVATKFLNRQDIFFEKLEQLSPNEYFSLRAYGLHENKDLNNRMIELVGNDFFSKFIVILASHISSNKESYASFSKLFENCDQDLLKNKIKSLVPKIYIDAFYSLSYNFKSLFDEEDFFDKFTKDTQDFYLAARNSEYTINLMHNINDKEGFLNVIFDRAKNLDPFLYFKNQVYKLLTRIFAIKKGATFKIPVSKRESLFVENLNKVTAELERLEQVKNSEEYNSYGYMDDYKETDDIKEKTDRDLSYKMKILYDDIYERLFNEEGASSIYYDGIRTADIDKNRKYSGSELDDMIYEMAKRFSRLAVSTGEEKYITVNKYYNQTGFPGFIFDHNFKDTAQEILSSYSPEEYIKDTTLSSLDSLSCLTLKNCLKFKNFDVNLKVIFVEAFTRAFLEYHHGYAAGTFCNSLFSEEEIEEIKEKAIQYAYDLPESSFFQTDADIHSHPFFIDVVIKHLKNQSLYVMSYLGGNYVNFETLRDIKGRLFKEFSDEYRTVLDGKMSATNNPQVISNIDEEHRVVTFQENDDSENENITFEEDSESASGPEDTDDLDF